MRIIHFCAGLEMWNGMANTARQFVAEECAQGHESSLTNDLAVVAKGGFDRLHIHGTWRPVLWKAAKLAKEIGAEVIVRPAGNYDPLRRRQGFFKRIKKMLVTPMEHAMLDRADAVQATCEAEAEWIKAYHPGAKIELTDLKRFFALGGEVRGNRSRSTADDKILKVLFLGRVNDPLKGVRFLEGARRKEQGGGSKCGRDIDVHYVSEKTGDELEREWMWCDVLCLPTLSENFGRVIAEALERGKRVVTTDGAPAWEDYFAKHPQCGVYIKGFREGDDEYRIAELKKALLGE